MSPLEAAIREEVLTSGAEAVGVAFLSTATGHELLIDADRFFHPASTFKLCVMIEAFRRDREGTFSLDAPVRVVNEFASIADGSPYGLDPVDDSDPDLYERIGEELPARDLVERMIVRSGNLATNILIEHLTAPAVTETMRRLGANDLVVRRGVEDNRAYALGLNNAATARGLTTALSKLLAREAVSVEADDEMIGILLRQEHNQAIPRLLPEGTPVAHKTGWNGPLYHDAGIVYPAHAEPYVLTVMTQGLEDEKGPDLVARISRLVYDADRSRF